eukprot:Sspe_Gene.23188::Locus_8984_Transcript_1_1_Confidence_1.000_Length_1051::g.23188::m.23188
MGTTHAEFMEFGWPVYGKWVAPLMTLLLFTGVLGANLVINEKIGRIHSNTDSGNTGTLHLYNWLGGIAWVIVLCPFAMCTIVIIPKFAITHVVVFNGVLALVFYAHLVTVAYFEPGNMWRSLELAERAQGAPVEVISCWHSKDPTQLVLKKDTGFVDLLDREWHVNWNSSHTKTTGDWTFTLSQIQYNGSVTGCQFNPPIWAVCITKGAPTPERCGFHVYGTSIMLRRLSISQDIEQEEWEYFPTSAAMSLSIGLADPFMFEWNSDWPEDVTAFVEKVRAQRTTMYRNYGISWGAFSLTALLVYTVCICHTTPAEEYP